MAQFRTPLIRLAESPADLEKPIQLFRVGTFHHAEYGKFTITPKMLADMEKNFKAGVRGIDLAVDYKHDNDDVAAGWIKSVHLSEDGLTLWAEVEWTPAGKKVIADKEFRYVSPEFTEDYQDNETLKKFGPALLGAGLTNRPTIKKMEPVMELTEIAAAADDDEMYVRWVTVEDEKTCPTCSDNDGKTLAEIGYQPPAHPNCRCSTTNTKASEKKAGVAAADIPSTKTAAVIPVKGSKQMMDQEKLAAMSPEELQKLVLELMAKLAAMEGEKTEMAGEKAKMEEKVAASEKKAQFTKMLSEGKVCAAQETAFISGDMVKFSELAQPVVKLTESGSSTEKTETKELSSKEEVETEISKLAQVKLSEKSAHDLGTAITMVLRERADLKEKLYA